MKLNDQDNQTMMSFDRKTDKSTVDASPLIAYLEHCQDWVLAYDISYFTPRQLRAMAQALDGQIISGNRGYKLTKKATIEEIRACSDRLKSQAKEMTARAIQIDRVYHATI